MWEAWSRGKPLAARVPTPVFLFYLDVYAMKKVAAVALLSLGVLLAACSKQEPAASQAAAPAAAPPALTKIVVGLDDNFPPMGFRDEKNE